MSLSSALRPIVQTRLGGNYLLWGIRFDRSVSGDKVWLSQLILLTSMRSEQGSVEVGSTGYTSQKWQVVGASPVEEMGWTPAKAKFYAQYQRLWGEETLVFRGVALTGFIRGEIQREVLMRSERSLFSHLRRKRVTWNDTELSVHRYFSIKTDEILKLSAHQKTEWACDWGIDWDAVYREVQTP